MAQLTCENLCVGYDNHIVCANLSFSVEKGDYLAIVGENGSGKTTLMKTLLGLIRPIRGKITTGDGLKANEIGYLPQQSEMQRDFPASVSEVVLSGFLSKMGLRPFYRKDEKAIAASNIKKMGLGGFENRSYRELSGGQQQRVLLARALCATEKLLLLDEPVTGLDPIATAELYQTIENLNKEGLTIIMISHDPEASLRYASHILHVGEKVFFGTKEQYLAGETIFKGKEVKQ